MNWADWAIIGIFSLSCVIGLIRGFVREALSLVIWISAVLVARLFGGQLENPAGRPYRNSLCSANDGIRRVVYCYLAIGRHA